MIAPSLALQALWEGGTQPHRYPRVMASLLNSCA